MALYGIWGQPIGQLIIIKKESAVKPTLFKILWAHQDLNLGPPDYESGALTN